MSESQEKYQSTTPTEEEIAEAKNKIANQRAFVSENIDPPILANVFSKTHNRMEQWFAFGYTSSGKLAVMKIVESQEGEGKKREVVAKCISLSRKESTEQNKNMSLPRRQIEKSRFMKRCALAGFLLFGTVEGTTHSVARLISEKLHIVLPYHTVKAAGVPVHFEGTNLMECHVRGIRFTENGILTRDFSPDSGVTPEHHSVPKAATRATVERQGDSMIILFWNDTGQETDAIGRLFVQGTYDVDPRH
ncbi:MAG: hypothetical protein WCG83_06360 [Candidatus Peregrinibacteria bacterium]